MFDQYLGDGVYASSDGDVIWLNLRGQDSYTRIALEPQVLEALDRYRKWLREQLNGFDTDSLNSKDVTTEA